MNPTRACYKLPLSPQKPHPYGNGRGALGSVMRNLKEKWSRCSEWRSFLEFDRTLKWRDSAPCIYIYIYLDRYYIYIYIYIWLLYICMLFLAEIWGISPKTAPISRTTPMAVSAMYAHCAAAPWHHWDRRGSWHPAHRWTDPNDKNNRWVSSISTSECCRWNDEIYEICSLVEPMVWSIISYNIIGYYRSIL